MHRIDTDGSVANAFSDGVPNVSQATVVDQAWLNAIQEELAFFIGTDAAIALVKGTNTQLSTALRKLYFRPGQAPSYGQDLVNALFLSARDADRDAGAGRQRIQIKGAGTGASEIWLTTNAAWDDANTRWVKDVAAVSNAILLSTAQGPKLFTHPLAATPFLDSDWTHPDTIHAFPYPNPATSWGDTGGGNTPGGYSKSPDGRVRLEGCASLFGGAVGDTLGSLPPGFRKNCIQRFSTTYLNGTHLHCTILIAANGAISTDAAVGAQLRLDGITFIADS